MRTLALALLVVTAEATAAGEAYLQSCMVAHQAGRHSRGSEEWDRRNREWLESDDDTPYPDDLRDVDGRGYQDARDAGMHPEDGR